MKNKNGFRKTYQLIKTRKTILTQNQLNLLNNYLETPKEEYQLSIDNSNKK